jgi:hypothetical protein
MAARIKTRVSDETRWRIKTSQLVNRLQDFALAAKNARGDKPVTMSAEQVRAAIALLKKTIPDLAATEHTGTVDGTLTVVRRVMGPGAVALPRAHAHVVVGAPETETERSDG